MVAQSFDIVPNQPFSTEELAELRAQLETFPTYHESFDDLYVVFGTPEDQRETVALYTRKTTPTFDMECFVMVRAAKLRVHPGGDRSSIEHLREFTAWVSQRFAVQLQRAGTASSLDVLLPTVSDLKL